MSGREVVSAAAANLGIKVAGAALGFAAAVALARWLGPEAYGVYAFALALVHVLAVVAGLGFPNMVMRDLAVAWDRRDGASWVGLTRFAAWATVAASALVAAAAVAVLALVDADAATLSTVAVSSALLLFTALAEVHRAVLRGQHAVVVATWPYDVARPALLIAFVAAMGGIAPARPEVAMVAHSVAAAAAVGLLVALRRGRAPPWLAGAPIAWTPRAWLVAAGPMLVLGGLGVLARHLDVLALKALATDLEVGTYAAASQIAGLSLFMLQSTNLVIAPRFASRFAAGDRAGLQRVASQGAASVGAVTVPLAVALLAGSDQALALFGPEFTGGRAALVWLVAGMVANASCGSVGFLLTMTGREGIVAAVLAVACGLGLVLDLLLIPTWGAAGAGAASAATMVLWNGVLLLAVRRELGIDPTVLAVLRGGARGGSSPPARTLP